MPHLVPRPASMTTTGPGGWRLAPTTPLRLEAGLEPVAGLLRELLGLPLPPDAAGPAPLTLRTDPSLAPEAYRIEVTPAGATVTAAGPGGHRVAAQTLRQLADGAAPDERGGVTVPCLLIEDAPRFRWRGLLIDVARHFYPVEFLHRLVDLAALHRLNVLHLHLTDDQGWRIEIEKYPRLTEVGAWRAETLVGRYTCQDDPDAVFDGTPHGGFYTKAELRALVAYAESRGITVVPEIDLPGHMRAAIAAYPELGNGLEPARPVCTTWGITEQILNVEESTLQFCRDVLTEVLEVFPGPYVHLGGDEVPKREWRESPRVQRRMRELGLPDESALAAWFTRQLAEFLTARGRRPIGWDELLEDGLPAGTALMSWRGEEGGARAARLGHDVVMTPHQLTYFTVYQAAPELVEQPLAVAEVLTAADVYAYRPVPAGLPAEAAAHVLGGQGCLWTELMPDARHVEYMAFPRLCALAEVLWGTAGDYPEFAVRLAAHLRRLDRLGVAHGPLPDTAPGTSAAG
ncbi:beta-N-acetylhexosaminidase [Kitasatospora cheerisanensis]|uniref:beta-N-acetylhexosaminidase n=1 Tax=Kitasatospora cheerisanensis KCTC 2395 TaxID=1348663 RepID=A0A066YIF5_9ACTN|nr:beta-N-acetylhexosaminidase [Kitasatospora cheerisanensis]KDN81258.1 beta-L-N-acetylhexosaminidase [Kitasatospora cheerisanensis KCTC 2395]